MSRPWPFRVTWHHESRDHSIPYIRFLHSIPKGFRDIKTQMYRGHYFDLLKSRDVISHVVTLRSMQFPMGVRLTLTRNLEVFFEILNFKRICVTTLTRSFMVTWCPYFSHVTIPWMPEWDIFDLIWFDLIWDRQFSFWVFRSKFKPLARTLSETEIGPRSFIKCIGVTTTTFQGCVTDGHVTIRLVVCGFLWVVSWCYS